jgi:hypothetical protein
LLGALPQIVLPLLAFAVMAHLMEGGLPHINVSGSLEVLRLNLFVHHSAFGFEGWGAQLDAAVRSALAGIEPGWFRAIDSRALSWAEVMEADDIGWIDLDT